MGINSKAKVQTAQILRGCAALLIVILLPVQAISDPKWPDMVCKGAVPSWTLNLMGDRAVLVFPSATDLEIKHSASAEGQDWPIALTLVGDRDTGIVLVHKRQCNSAPYEAQLLTQRGQTPILLTGCCERAK